MNRTRPDAPDIESRSTFFARNRPGPSSFALGLLILFPATSALGAAQSRYRASYEFEGGNPNNLSDESGNANTLVLNVGGGEAIGAPGHSGAASLVTTGANGSFASVAVLNGTLEAPEGFTIEAWIRPAGAVCQGNGNPTIVLSKKSAFNLGFKNVGGICLLYSEIFPQYNSAAGGVAGVAAVMSAASGTLAPNLWQNIALVYDGVTERLYLDGELVLSASLPFGPIQQPAPATSLYIGQDPTRAVSFNGDIDEVRFSWGPADPITCPPATTPMEGLCCPANTTPSNGICCPTNTTGSAGHCCPTGTADSQGLCCPTLSQRVPGAAFCMDSAKSNETNYGDGMNHCAARGMQVCTFSQMYTAVSINPTQWPDPSTTGHNNYRVADIMYQSNDTKAHLGGVNGLVNNQLDAPNASVILNMPGPFGSAPGFGLDYYCCY